MISICHKGRSGSEMGGDRKVSHGFRLIQDAFPLLGNLWTLAGFSLSYFYPTSQKHEAQNDVVPGTWKPGLPEATRAG